MTTAVNNYNVFVMESEYSVLDCLVEQIKTSKETQVIVTGPMVRNLYWKDTKGFKTLLKQTFNSEITTKQCSHCGTVVLKKNAECPYCGKKVFDVFITGSDWQYFGPPYNPSRKAIIDSLDSFANTIKHEPRLPHIYIGPIYKEEVVKRLFYPNPSQSYKCGVYILGIYEEQIKYLNTISRAVSGLPHMTGSITCIFSISDHSIADQFRRRIRIAKERQEDIRELTFLYFKYKEDTRLLELQYRKPADKKLIRDIKNNLRKEVIPKLYPKKYFPEMQLKAWWKFW